MELPLYAPKEWWENREKAIKEITVDELKEALALSIQAVGSIIVGE